MRRYRLFYCGPFFPVTAQPSLRLYCLSGVFSALNGKKSDELLTFLRESFRRKNTLICRLAATGGKAGGDGRRLKNRANLTAPAGWITRGCCRAGSRRGGPKKDPAGRCGGVGSVVEEFVYCTTNFTFTNAPLSLPARVAT